MINYCAFSMTNTSATDRLPTWQRLSGIIIMVVDNLDDMIFEILQIFGLDFNNSFLVRSSIFIDVFFVAVIAARHNHSLYSSLNAGFKFLTFFFGCFLLFQIENHNQKAKDSNRSGPHTYIFRNINHITRWKL